LGVKRSIRCGETSNGSIERVQLRVESAEGTSPSAAPRSGREALTSSGSTHSAIVTVNILPMGEKLRIAKTTSF